MTHLTSNGCNVQIGDLIGSGTISGPRENECGSLLEYTLNGTKPFGDDQTYLMDGDTVMFKGFGQGNGYKIGFGDCSGKII